MLDQALEALKTYDWGTDTSVLTPIDDAIAASQGDPAVRADLERQLAGVLKTELTIDAVDYVCRKLMVIGSSASLPVLAELLLKPAHSHMARYALERISSPEAGQTLHEALEKMNAASFRTDVADASTMLIGVMGSLGVRRHPASVPALTALLAHEDAAVARAAACALGAIQTPEAAQALVAAKTNGPEAAAAVIDASLACAERLLSDGKKVEALAIYKRFGSDGQAKHVRLAATRGVLACAGKKE